MDVNIPHISQEEKHRLGLLLKRNVALQSSDEGLLRSVVHSWPWFQEAWILLALWENTFTPERFQVDLPGLALRGGNRSKLDALIHGRWLEDNPEVQKPLSKPISPIDLEEGKAADELPDRTTFLENLVKKRLEAIAREKAEVGFESKQKPDIKKDEIIERFIQEEPKMRPRKDISPEPDEKAEQSVRDDSSLVSETLARIHEKQGNHQKAIEIYRSLSLKYPQKSAYFAAQIEKLQEKLKP